MVHYAILTPYWNVPTDRAQKKIAPKIRAGRSLKSMRMEVLSDWSASPSTLDPATIDWAAVAAGAQEIRMRPLPGRGNSMGRVKFLFPNDHGIYLHDKIGRAHICNPVTTAQPVCRLLLERTHKKELTQQ